MTSETDNKVEAAVERLPYRAEYGAVHHKDTEPGFVFTVSPPAFAEDVAAALNARDRLAAEVERLTAECASHGFWRIVEFFDKLGIGTGDDPIGFLLASHIHLAHQRNEAQAAIASLDRTVPAEPTPGEVRVIDGKRMRFVEHDDRGQVWEVLPAEPAQEVAGLVDARRYRRLRVLGCAVTDTPQLDAGTVVRFTGLDDLLDADLKDTPSRGEFPAEPAQEVAGVKSAEAVIRDGKIVIEVELFVTWPPSRLVDDVAHVPNKHDDFLRQVAELVESDVLVPAEEQGLSGEVRAQGPRAPNTRA